VPKSSGFTPLRPGVSRSAVSALLKISAARFSLTQVTESLDQIFVNAKHWILSWFAGAPEWVAQIVSSLISISAMLVVFLTLFAMMSLFERKILARIRIASAQIASVPSACCSQLPTASRC
jgi:hypothetical protein